MEVGQRWVRCYSYLFHFRYNLRCGWRLRRPFPQCVSQALLGELSSQVQSALTKLSPELREAVILRDLQQLEYSEIQIVLSVPEGTVKSRINRGRIELARILQQMGVRPS